MNKVCSKCGKESESQVAFCIHCGEKLAEKAVNTPPEHDAGVNVNRATRVAGIGAFFGLMALFALPVVGFVACIVMSFALKNKNLKNFSRAVLIWYIIGIVVLGLLVLTVYLLSGVISEYIQGVAGTDLSSAGAFFDGLSELSEIKDTMSQLVTEGIETIPVQ